jgi:catechol 2,3-dioxygenase-like lactoylglutathione lyase family enzyme
MSGIQRLAAIQLVSRDPAALARFYQAALGFEPSLACDGVALALGPTRIELIQAGGDARPYPADVPGWSPLFQHCAIITTDMAASHQRLSDVGGWKAITVGGPQRLPASSGGVTAFKFRDPEGHPLELLFAPGAAEAGVGQEPNRRIGHSAISVADPARSVAFYHGLGFHVGARGFNQGPEQARLDGLPNARADVITLIPPDGEPHLELLAYQGDFDRRGDMADPDDIAATRLVLTVADRDDLAARPGLSRDPDGHLYRFVVEDDVAYSAPLSASSRVS